MGSLSGRILVGVLVPALAVWGRWRLRNAGRRLSGGWRGERQRSSCGTDGSFRRTAWRSRRRPSWGGRSGAGPGIRHPRDVEAICYRERGRGALEGAGLGALVGAGGIAPAIAADCSDSAEGCRVWTIVGAIVGAVIGPPVGLAIGAVRGSQICVRFASDGSP